jgi:hypothetical protein
MIGELLEIIVHTAAVCNSRLTTTVLNLVTYIRIVC